MMQRPVLDPTEVNVSVAVRVRPTPVTPNLRGRELNFVTTGPYSNFVSVGNIRGFHFDHVLPMECNQSQFFGSTVNPLVPYLLEGYDVTVMAYGQAGSGKTYTILGPGPHCALSEMEFGIAPRATREVFNRMRSYPERKFRITVTFVEIYQEMLRDLLNSNTVHSNLHIVEDLYMGMKVEGAERVECGSTADVLQCLLAGMNNRQRGEKAHTIFTLYIEQQIEVADQAPQQRVSQLMLVDLAGSERLCSEGSVRLDSSLAALGNLIHSLASQQSVLTSTSPQQSHLPYRDSKLTQLLKSSLGGRAITMFICCVSGMKCDLTDTLNTLNCGQLVQAVKNRPVMNVFASPINTPVYEDSRFPSYPPSIADNMFGMEFVMHQWKRLVTDAEGLFHQITEGQGLSVEDLEHIRRWLCLKQECEEIVASQHADSLGQLLHRSLDVIGEMSESEEKVDEDEQQTTTDEENKGEEGGEEEEEPREVASASPNKSYISTTQSDVETETKHISTPELLSTLDNLMEDFKIITDLSIHEIQSNESNDLQLLHDTEEQFTVTAQPDANVVATERLVTRRNSVQPDAIRLKTTSSTNLNELDVKAAVDGNSNAITKVSATELIEHSDCTSRENQMKLVMLDVQGVTLRINELEHTIQLKEEMLQDLITNSEVRLVAKQKLERKLRKIQDAYKNSQLKLAQVEKIAQHQSRLSPKVAEDLEKYRRAVHTYKQRLKDISSIHHIAEDSAEKIVELERGLEASKRQMEKLKRQLRREEKVKSIVEKNFEKEQLALRSAELSKSEDSKGSFRKQEDKLLGTSDSHWESKKLSLHVGELKLTGGLHETKEGSLMKKAIRKLRRAKDSLITQRCELNKKFRLEKFLSPEEERKVLELEEGIEAIDAAIEYKNELLCGRSGDFTVEAADRYKGENELMGRLVGLTLPETKMLLYKYFQKVIDLRDSSRKLEIQVAEHETQSELQTWRFQALGHALQQARYAAERHLVTQQRAHEEKLHLLLRHCAEESGLSGTEGGSSSALNPCSADLELRRENKMLRRKLEEAHLTVHTHHASRRDGTPMNVIAIPETNLRRLQARDSASTTRITREKNKLVIQQHKRRRSPQ